MSGLQSLRILTLVLVSVVAAVDTGSGDFNFLSIGNLYFKLLLLLLLCSLSRATFCLFQPVCPSVCKGKHERVSSPVQQIEARTACPLRVHPLNLTRGMQCIVSVRDLHGALVFHSFTYHYLFQLAYLHLTNNNTFRLISRSSSPPTVACKL